MSKYSSLSLSAVFPLEVRSRHLQPPDRSRHLQGAYHLCFSSLPGGSSSESVLVNNQWRRITPVVGSRAQCSRGDRRCDHPLDRRFSTPSWTPSWRRNNSGFGDNLDPLYGSTLRNTPKTFLSSCKNQFNKKYYFFISCCFQGPPLFPQIGLWTLSPRFLRGFPSP